MAQDRTIVQIRERSFLDLHDLALLLIRNRPWPVSASALAGVLPFVLLNEWVLAPIGFSDGFWPIVLMLEAPWATAPLTLTLGGVMFGRPPSIRALARRLLLSLPAMIFAHVLVRGFLCATIFLIPVIPGSLGFQGEVILLERTGWFRAMRRSSQLTAGRGMEFVGRWMAQLSFGAVFLVCFWAGTGAAISGLFSSSITWERPSRAGIGGFRSQAGLWIAISFFAVARFLIYLDQRIRLEGWEVRLRLQAAGRQLEEAGR